MQSTVRWGEAPGDPLADLQRMIKVMQEVPPPPFFGSTILAPPGSFYGYEEDTGRMVTIAHPAEWAKVPLRNGEISPLFSVPIIDLDQPHNLEKRAEVLLRLGME